MLAIDGEVQARRARVEELLRCVCDKEELPSFVADEATLFDVCTLTPEEIVNRLALHYGRTVHLKEVRLPIWRLVDWLHAGNT